MLICSLFGRLDPLVKLSIHAYLQYHAPQPCDLLLQVAVADYPGQIVQRTDLNVAGQAPQHVVAGEGGIGQRVWMRVDGAFKADYRAGVAVTREVVDFTGLAQMPLSALDAAAIGYLMPSRYCFPEDFFDFVVQQFPGLRGGPRVVAMVEWIGQNFTYDAFATQPNTTATDSFVARRGVCRDYAHVLIAMLRAVGIPARIVSAYAPAVTPQDFHAVVEVYLDNAWHLIDPTGMANAADIAVVGVGRDAADISFMTSYGLMELQEQAVTVSKS